MFGLGFLFSAALVGAGLVGWPIYLHFRKRNRTVQVVPSLRLFGFVRKRTKRLRIQQLLLLIARATILIALFMLLAQPFIRTKLQLPFPRVAGDAQEERILAVIIDDSISSLHEDAKGTRLKQSKAAIKACIQSLPKQTKVVFAPTSCPFPTEPQDPEQALVFLDKIETVPVHGNAVDALRNAADSLTGRPCCIVIATPRQEKLWNKLKFKIFKQETPVVFFDASAIASEALITGCDDNAIHIAGKPKVMQLSKIQIESQDGDIEFLNVTTHDALRGEIDAAITSAGSHFRKVSFVRETTNPWNSYYAQTGKKGPSKPDVAIVREVLPQSILIDQMISAILLSFNDNVVLHHINPAKPEALPDADVLVIAGNPRLPQALRPWINQRVAGGCRFLCIPTAKMTTGGKQLAILPDWGSLTAVRPDDLPLLTNIKSKLPLDDLAALGIAKLPIDKTYHPNLGDKQETILSTKAGYPVLVTNDLGKGGAIWAFGSPLDSAPGGPAWHPAFPMLMQQIMLPGGQVHAGDEALVGQTIRLHEWFGRDDVAGVLKSPNGSSQRVTSSNIAPLTITLDEVGPYSLTTDADETLWRVVNYPRDTDAITFPRQQFEKQGELAIRWASDTVKVGPSDFRKLGQPIDQEAYQVLDLSAVALALLAAALLLECIMLWVVWRREGFVRA